MSKLIRGDQVGEAERWELPEMDSRARKPLRPPTAEQIEQIRQAAFEEGREEGRQKGRNEGYEQGLKEGRERVDEAAQSLREMVGKLARPLEELDEQISKEMLELLTLSVREILMRELQLHPADLREIIQTGLQMLPSSARRGVVYVNEQDRLWLEEAGGLELDDWSLKARADIDAGGCQIEAQHSSVDRTLETRIQEIVEAVLGNNDKADNSS